MCPLLYTNTTPTANTTISNDVIDANTVYLKSNLIYIRQTIMGTIISKYSVYAMPV